MLYLNFHEGEAIELGKALAVDEGFYLQRPTTC